MDKVIPIPKSKCKYFRRGCTAALVDSERSRHEEWCPYRRFRCPCPADSCEWKGPLEQMLSHLTSVHPLKILQGESIEFVATEVDTPGDIHWVLIQSCFKRFFMVILWRREVHPGLEQFHAAVQMIDTKTRAESYNYKLELVRPPRRLSWEGVPFSLDRPIRTLQIDTDCLIFDVQKASLFVKDEMLTMTVTISEVTTASK